MPSAARVRSLVRGWGPVAPLLLAPFGVALSVYGRYVCDDDLIMLRYAERLASGDGLTWTDGERVHGVSALLLVLLAAAFRTFGVPLEVTMRVFSSTGVLAAALCVLVASRREGFSRVVSAGLAGALVLFAPFSVWTGGGVGGPVFAALAGWAVLLAVPSTREPRALVASRSRRVVLVVLLCVLQLVRPDAPLVVACVLLLAVRGVPGHGVRPRAGLLVSLLVPVVVFGVLLAGVQLWYFGTPVPHLAGVKIAPDLSLVRVGVLYVLEFARGFFPLLLLVPVLLFAALRRRDGSRDGSRDGALFAVLGPLFPAMVWVLYLVWVGGDWMPGNRHFALVLVLLVVSALRASALVARRRAAVSVLLAVSLVTGAVSMGAPAAVRGSRSVDWLEFTCTGSERVGTLFSGLDPLLAVEPGGCVPYVTGFRSLDMLGLNDLHVSTMRPTGRPVTWDEWTAARSEDPQDPGLGRMFIPGHGNGDGAYVWGREPDLLVPCNPSDPTGTGCFRSFFELRAGFDFASRYRLLSLDVADEFDFTGRYGLSTPVTGGWAPWSVWVRHDAGPLGVRYAASGGRTVPASDATVVTVPSWLLTAPDAPLRVEGPGAASVALPAGGSLVSPPLVLSAGSWEVVGLPEGVSVALVGACGGIAPGGRVVLPASGCPLVLRLSSPAPVSVEGFELLRS